MGMTLLIVGAGLAMAARGAETLPWDPALARAVQQPVSPWLDRFAWAVSRAGDSYPTVVVFTVLGVVVLLVRGRRDLALFLGVVGVLRAVGPGLKRLIDSPRPTADSVLIGEPVTGLGFPSGHALGAALFYGAIALIAPRVVRNPGLARGIQAAAVLMIALTALSRVRLGVHWPSDVMGGVFFGLGFVCVLWAGLLFWEGNALKR